MTWWVVDNGGGMQVLGGGDTIWASIGQTANGPANSDPVYLGAGYLYGESTELKIIQSEHIPDRFAITSISPNPFNSVCEIEFEVSKQCDVAIQLFDMQGKKIGNLIDSKDVDAGNYKLKWNAGNLSSGVYLVRLNAEDIAISKRIILVR